MNNKTFFSIRIYGDSLSLPRIGFVKNQERYLWLLKKYWENLPQLNSYEFEILDRSKVNATIIDVQNAIDKDDAYFGEFKDITIIQCGICDCAPRPIPPKMRNWVAGLNNNIRHFVVRLIKKYRAVIQKKIHWRTVEIDLFEKTYFSVLEQLSTNSKIVYVINIAPTNDKTEKHSPGLKSSIRDYNQIINKIIQLIDKKNIYLIDVYNIINQDYENIDNYILKEDGHHITALSHKLYANTIIKKEQNSYIT